MNPSCTQQRLINLQLQLQASRRRFQQELLRCVRGEDNHVKEMGNNFQQHKTKLLHSITETSGRSLQRGLCSIKTDLQCGLSLHQSSRHCRLLQDNMIDLNRTAEVEPTYSYVFHWLTLITTFPLKLISLVKLHAPKRIISTEKGSLCPL